MTFTEYNRLPLFAQKEFEAQIIKINEEKQKQLSMLSGR